MKWLKKIVNRFRANGVPAVSEAFWNQGSFKVWVVMVVLLGVFAPIVATRVFEFFVRNLAEIIIIEIPAATPDRAQVLEIREKQHISLVALAILSFAGFMAIWYKTQKNFIKMLLGWGISVYLLYLIVSRVTINQFAVFTLFWLIAQAATIYLLYHWGRKCFFSCGTAENPAEGIPTRWGKPILGNETIGPGGLFFVFFPFERIRLFPTQRYEGSWEVDLMTKADKDNGISSQLIHVEGTFYYGFPIHTEVYDMPSCNGVERVSGKDLLIRAFWNLPIADLMAPNAWEDMNDHFRESVVGGVRTVMTGMSVGECLERKKEIEDKTKTYVGCEDGNSFHDCGVPPKRMDVEITRIDVPKEVMDSHVRWEIATRDAITSKEERKAIANRVKGLTDAGVPPEIAGLGEKGKIDPDKYVAFRFASQWPQYPMAARHQQNRRT